MFKGKVCAGLRALYEQDALEFHGEMGSRAGPQAFEQLLRDRDRNERIAQARKWLGLEKEQQAQPAAEAGAIVQEKNSRLRCPHCGALALVWIEERPPSHQKCQRIGICDSS